LLLRLFNDAVSTAVIIKRPVRREDMFMGEERKRIDSLDMLEGVMKGFAWRG
jgi:hypothetical protein